jgi:hypothetical protein
MILKKTFFNLTIIVLSLTIQNTYSQNNESKLKWDTAARYDSKAIEHLKKVKGDLGDCFKKDQTLKELNTSFSLYVKAIRELKMAISLEKHQIRKKNGPNVYANKSFINKCGVAIKKIESKRTSVKKYATELKEICDVANRVTSLDINYEELNAAAEEQQRLLNQISEEKSTKKIGCISGDCNKGYAEYRWADGATYKGLWKDGKRNGYGVYNWAKGGVYKGQWKDDNKNGEGTYTSKDNSTLTGIWKDGKIIREQVLEKKIGCVFGDCSSAYGTYIWESGEQYEGEWLNNRRNGVGSNTFTSGVIYYGQWKNDMRHGLGTTISKEGVKKRGTWVNGVYSK